VSSPATVAAIRGRPVSLEGVRRTAWLSQHTGLPLTVVRAHLDTPAGPARARMQSRHDPEEPA